MKQNIFEALRESHETQRLLAGQLISARTPVAQRRGILSSLRKELLAHEAAEERFFYVPLLMTDGGLNSSRHALSEHHDIDELLEDLEGVSPRSSSWLGKAKALIKKVRHHLKEEETKFFQVAGKLLSEKEKTSLAKKYLTDFEKMKAKV